MAVDTGTPRHPRLQAALLCLVLSLLLHGALLLLIPTPSHRHAAAPAAPARRVQVLRPATPKAEDSAPQESQERPFAKTSADAPEQRPDHAENIGARNSRAESDPTARDPNKATPAVDGREESEETVTFDQEAQDGPIEHEGKQPETPPVSAPAAEPEAPADSSPTDAPADEQTTPSAPPAPAGSLTLRPLPQGEGDVLPLRQETEQEAEPTEQSPAARRKPRGMLLDPALAPDAQQPGFRTRERKTRSSGRFIFGRGAALNVEATPRGQYEAEIYRRVARLWYAACDAHRGDIIPGQITISLRLNRHGQLANMQLLSRRGASISQQSFTFAAIRHAALPPMPSEVQSDIVGELLELIFTFHFD